MTDYRKFNDIESAKTSTNAKNTSSAVGGQNATMMTTSTTDYQTLETYDGVYKPKRSSNTRSVGTGSGSSSSGSGKNSNNNNSKKKNRRKFNTIYMEDCDDGSDDDYFHIPHPRPEYYMTDLMIENIQNDTTLSEYDIMVIQRLACRKFHVPGNSFIEDYLFWFRNNHILFSFCYADPRHPFGKQERILNLISSLAFGLAATCCVVLYYHYFHSKNAFNTVFLTLFGSINVTTGMVALFVFSGPVHVIFDLGVFFLQSCPPCRPGGFCEKQLHLPNWHQQLWLWLGSHLAFIVAIASSSLAIHVMLIRASVAEHDGDDSDISFNIRSYSFLLLYLLEVFMTHFIAFPICTFTVFSGVLGCCGRLPGLGGRPYQVRKHEEKRKKLLLQQQQQQQQQPLRELCNVGRKSTTAVATATTNTIQSSNKQQEKRSSRRSTPVDI